MKFEELQRKIQNRLDTHIELHTKDFISLSNGAWVRKTANNKKWVESANKPDSNIHIGERVIISGDIHTNAGTKMYLAGDTIIDGELLLLTNTTLNTYGNVTLIDSNVFSGCINMYRGAWVRDSILSGKISLHKNSTIVESVLFGSIDTYNASANKANIGTFASEESVDIFNLHIVLTEGSQVTGKLPIIFNSYKAKATMKFPFGTWDLDKAIVLVYQENIILLFPNGGISTFIVTENFIQYTVDMLKGLCTHTEIKDTSRWEGLLDK